MSERATQQVPQSQAQSGLPTRFVPRDHEGRVRAAWDASGAFHADPDRVLSGEKPPYAIFIPPPNVTARLHLGHALNNSLQDILARAHRMMGFEVLWMPGTDHAGIATQTVVEQRIQREEGKRRADFTRDEFIARVQAWKDEYEKAITDQLKAIGSSCDWQRQRFTMDEICARAVREAFFRLFRDGLIYRGKRLVNWDPVTQTALSDDEVEMEEVNGFFYYLRYPLVRAGGSATPVTWSELARLGYPGAGAHPADQPGWVTVATTRPETYLGDTAVAINPHDPRASALKGLSARLPLVGRVIPIIEDSYVVLPDPKSDDPKAKYATGFLKVTPAHDPNDYEIGRRHDLPIINVMAPDASISDKHGWTDIGDAHLFVGLPREAAREKVVAEFKARALLEAVKPYSHSVGHSYRSHAAIEPYLSDQWYCKVTDDRLRGWAQRALVRDQRDSDTWPSVSAEGDGAMRFFPSRYARTYESWHDNLRDWCISRQLWWGHQIPVWSAEGAAPFEAGPDVAVQTDGVRSFVSVRDAATTAALCKQLEAAGFERDPDVLDTWFSSALWPLSTLGWPEPPASMRGLLDAFNPSAVLCTAREIITLWVSRMVMFNRYFTRPGDDQPGQLPFSDVYIHPLIQDGHGQRMSKSLGNGVDPLDIVHSHGSDALRFVLAQTATATQDVRMPVDLVCPHCEQAFEPQWAKSPAGYTVAAPEQKCPHCTKPSVSAYGVSSGSTKPTKDAPQARNSSSKFDLGRNFCTKLWNASRFAMMKLEGGAAAGSNGALTLPDRWILSRLAASITKLESALSEYQFSVYAQTMYDLLWRDFCDWYLEAIKPTIDSNAAQRAVLRATLDSILRLLHPVCPFITEVLHEPLRRIPASAVPGLTLRNSDLLCTSGWPEATASLSDPGAERAFERIQTLVSAIREARSAKSVEPRRRVTLHADADTMSLIAQGAGVVETLAGLASCTESAPDGPSAVLLFEGRELAISGLADAVDPAVERAQLADTLAKLEKDIAVVDKRLSNPGYVDKAPAKLVEETRASLAQKQAERDTVQRRLKELS